MRLANAMFSALLTLGLGAIGILAAQRVTVRSTSPTSISRLDDTAQASALETAKPTISSEMPSVQGVPAPAPAKGGPACDKPDGMGLARVVEIDATGGPAFGTEHFKQYDFLRDHEVVLTFDDGPWPDNTPAVIKALTDMCVKATFFEIGEHATWRPDISKMVAAAGMTIGSHTWSHKDLAKNPYAKDL